MSHTLLVTCLVVASRAAAHAEHEHGPLPTSGEPASESAYVAGIALVAATYETMLYAGDYEGAVPAFRWSHGRFGASASVPLYRLVRNGRTTYGPGDASLHGQVMIAGDRSLAFGAVLGLGLPTGKTRVGLGMGHAMAMPALFVSAELARVRLAGSAGYGHALGGAHAHDEHGGWPLVDPMTESELTFSASGDVALVDTWRAGARITGAIPTDDAPARAIAAARTAWGHGRFETALELQAGLAGDPFQLRGVVETAVRF